MRQVADKTTVPAALASQEVAAQAALPAADVIATSPVATTTGSVNVAAFADSARVAVTPTVEATAPPVAAVAGSVAEAGSGLLGWLAGGDGGAPGVGPLAWSMAAASRREFGGALRVLSPAAVSLSSGQLVADAVTAVEGQPYVRRISLPLGRTYGTDQTMTFTLHFNEPVVVHERVLPDNPDVTLPVTLPVQVGFAIRDAEYVRGSGTRSLTFKLKVTADDVGAVSIGRVSTALMPGATAPARIFDFNGAGREVPQTPVSNPVIVDRDGVAASETIPSVNTARIQVDARGPEVVGYGQGGAISVGKHRAVLQVTFDQPVVVKGKPTVPVTVDGVNGELVYVRGSGSNTLTFALRSAAELGEVSFGTRGQVIDLPPGADILDRLGNSAVVIRGKFGAEPGTLGAPLVENGNTMVVLGSHYEFLRTVGVDELNNILTVEAKAFYAESTKDPDTGQDPAPYLVGYDVPTFEPATHSVDLYRVAYSSTIPEQGNRPTTAYGLVAIPQGTTGPLPVMSYQHGTIVFKGEVPSQSFDTSAPVTYYLSYENRLNVAQFAGQGYAVIAADYFGVGNSIENDGYISKASQQQACLDMYTASLNLLKTKGFTTSDLFLGGWSQGGLVTVDFLEKLESLGIPVRGASTASAPANVQLTSNAWYFNPRQYTETDTGDAPWLNVVGELSNFSITGYAGYPDSPLQMLGVNYEAARAMYMRQFNNLLFPDPYEGGTGIIVERTGLANVTLPYDLQQVIAPQYSGVTNEVAFSQTEYAQLLEEMGAGQTYLASNMRMYYGSQDEVIPLFSGTAVYDWQTESFGKKNIEALEVDKGNHRGTFLSAVRGQLDWFNSLRTT